MGSEPSFRQPGVVMNPIVAFDFDGTLTVRDSFTAFLGWRARPWRLALGMVRLAPAAAAWLGHRDRGRIKAAAVREFLRGHPREALEAEAEAFMEATWDRFMRPDALACWDEWGRRGALRVIVTEVARADNNPFLVSCTAGRDRTGIVVACLLELIDVTDEAIAIDYAASDPFDPDTGRAHAGTMLELLSLVRGSYGSVRRMLQSCGLADGVVESLRSRLLARANAKRSA